MKIEFADRHRRAISCDLVKVEKRIFLRRMRAHQALELEVHRFRLCVIALLVFTQIVVIVIPIVPGIEIVEYVFIFTFVEQRD